MYKVFIKSKYTFKFDKYCTNAVIFEFDMSFKADQAIIQE